jgi:peptidyl-prolyl cis-trans isomerase A (cyclophilin A)
MRQLLLLMAIGVVAVAQEGTVPVVIETELGKVEVEIAIDRAPITASNFLKYVDGGLYDGGRFHRTVRPDNQAANKVKIDVIQAGPVPSSPGFAAIPLERTTKTGLSHKDGSLSMARDGPDSATADFFICIGDQPSLDFGGERNPDGQGFAAFGRVIKGMDVVRKIHDAQAERQKLTPPVKILRMYRKT